MAYTNVDIRITAARGFIGRQDRYIATIVYGRQRERTQFSFPAEEWRALETDFREQGLRLISDMRGPVINDSNVVRRFGRVLFQALFDSNRAVARLYESIWNQEEEVRLRLHIEDSRLLNLPWEMLFDPRHNAYLALCLSPKFSIVRWNGRKQPDFELSVLKLRILIVTSQPRKMSDVAVERELENIRLVLSPLVKDGRIEMRVIEAKPSELDRVRNGTWHVLHFIGHGERGELIMLDENGYARWVKAATFASELPPGVRLVILNSCDGGKQHQVFAFTSTANRLMLYGGVPAVLAMLHRIPNESAIVFARAFYTALIGQNEEVRSLESAVVQARNELHGKANESVHWATPVLYMSQGLAVKIGRKKPPPPPLWLMVLLVVLVLLSISFIFARYYLIDMQAGPTAPPVVTGCNVDSSLYTQTTEQQTPSLGTFTPDSGVYTRTVKNSVIGISNGGTFFDMQRGNEANELLSRAASEYQKGNDAAYDAYLRDIIDSVDPTNAEAQIYYENYRILKSGKPYITVVLGTSFTKSNMGGTRDVLQGVVTAQKNHNALLEGALNALPSRLPNNHFQGCPSVVVLIANSGGDENNTQLVADQIKTLARLHQSVVGVLGWTLSAHAINARSYLADSNLLMLSPTASSKGLTNTPRFYRIVPEDDSQAHLMVQYLAKRHSNSMKRVAIFRQLRDNYSSSLGNVFRENLEDVFPEVKIYNGQYFQGDAQSIEQALRQAVEGEGVKVICFAGYVGEASLLLNALQKHIDANDQRYRDILIVGGDAISILANYPANQRGLDHLLVTSFATSDEWEWLASRGFQQANERAVLQFRETYKRYFQNDQLQLANGFYGIDCDVMLGYDALNVLLETYRLMVAEGNGTCGRCLMSDALVKLQGDRIWQGVSGQISFQASGNNPVNKAVAIATVDVKKKQIKTEEVYGCFFPNVCRNP
uniref:CHAT domain-containing protein n=1 Tax=Thermosporothrix sp. COM3 TaxID=2490863 RepID=A0A455SGE2_9CHLR|nr:hypothetical protein KTC_08330 [Thermosporothrix sp. COM3]